MSQQDAALTSLEGSLDFERWCEGLRAGRLIGQECADCGHVQATPKAGCLDCRSRSLSTVELPTSGVIHTASGVGVAPAEMEPGYQLGIVELSGTDGTRILARIEGAADIGRSVEFQSIFEHDGTPAPVFG